MNRPGILALTLPLALSVAACGGPGQSSSLDSSKAALGVRALASEASGPRSVARIFVSTHAQVDELARTGMDLFEDVHVHEGYVDATVRAQDIAYLRSHGFGYVITGSAAPRVDALGLGTFAGGYHTVAQVQAEFQKLAQQDPKIARYSVIGKSLQGRDIFMLEIASHPGTTPQILFDSGQHARELPPVELTYRLADLLVSSYGKNADLTKLVDTRDIYIVPIVNPDGRIDVEQGDTFWRKNLRDNGDGTKGVDTNRNSNDHWSQGDTDGSADDFRGSAPDSEPETQAMRELTASHHFRISLDIHNYAGMVLYPPGYDDATTPDAATFDKIGHHLADPIGYQAGTIAQLLYNTYGDLSTWQYDRYGVIAFGLELNDSAFDAPYSEVDRDWQQWEPNFTWLIQIADHPRAQAAALRDPQNSGEPSYFPHLQS